MSQGPEEGQAAVPVGGGRAQPGFKIDHSKPYAHETHAVPVGGGRAWPGFEIDHSERSSRVAISRAAGPDGARNTSGATSNTGDLARPQPQQAAPRAAAAQ